MQKPHTRLTGQDSPPQGGLAGFLFANAARGILIVTALFFCAATVTLGGAYTAYRSAGDVKRKHMPLMEAARAFEGRVYEAVFHIGIFGSTGDMANYSSARIRFADIRESADAVTKLAAAISRGREVEHGMELAGDLARGLDLAVEKQRTLIESLAFEREKLRKTADDLADILLSLRAGTASTPSPAGKKTDIEPDGRACLLALNGFSLAMEAVTTRATAGLATSAAEVAVAEEIFGKYWQEAREDCRLAGRDVFERMETSVASYREIMGLLRFNLEEVERLGMDRENIIGRLAGATRGVVALVRDTSEEAVTHVEDALFAALLFGGALFAVALAIGASIFFGRRSYLSPVTNSMI